MHWTDIAGAITELAAFPIGLYYLYFSPQSKFRKKTWVLVLLGIGFLASSAHVTLNYLAKVREAEAETAQLRKKVMSSVDQGGTVSAQDTVFASPDGYWILIPAGYTYSKPAGTPFSMIAIKNATSIQTPAMSVMTLASNATNDEFSDQIRKGMVQKNSSTKFTEPVKIRNGTTDLDRVEMTSTRDGGHIKGIVLFATKSGKNYAVILGTKEDMYAAAKPEFERIASSFTFDKPDDKPAAAQSPAASPAKAADAPVAKTEPAPQAAVAPAAAAAPAPAAPIDTGEADRAARAKARDEQLARQRADAAREAEAKRKQQASENKCVYKAVMTDADLANCR